MNNADPATDTVLSTLRNPRTIRKQAQRLLDLAKQDALAHFSLHPEHMAQTADFIVAVMRSQYPDLQIPYHSRWRHFEAGDSNRINNLLNQAGNPAPQEAGIILYELVLLSVFLDAGAGALWRYRNEEDNKEYTRSEGLALASLALYKSGVLSADKQNPFRVDATRLLEFTAQDLQKAFQVTPENPLEGVSGRVALLNQLGRLVIQKPELFGKQGRLGDFYSSVYALHSHNSLSAASIFHQVISGFDAIWPKRLTFHGHALGDVWIHQALKTDEPGSEYIPFHKLSQWLTYSLIEPLEQAGIQVTDLESLTGLPEYRNGGLLVDSGLLQVKNKALLLQAQDPGSEAIVEWRGLTVALLDALAPLIRQQLQMDATTLPLAKILQGGTWEAGRRIARQKRAEGTPPIQIISDGTLF